MTSALAAAIFIVDTLTPPEIALAVLYVVVVLLSARFCAAREVVLVAAGCVALTVLGYLLAAEFAANALIAIGAIVLTTILVLKDQSRELAKEEMRKLNQQLADRARELEASLAHATRVTTMSELTASIAHEVNQPIAASVIDAGAALHFLGAQPPDVEEARQALKAIVQHGRRAGEVVGRIRDLIKRMPPRQDGLDINEAIRDVVELARNEAAKNGISMQMELGAGLPLIRGDRVQLQQVILNLVMNAIEAMRGMSEGVRALRISTEADAASGAKVTVRDTGPGIDPADLDRVFERFYTTKPDGLGMGLAICRSIIEAHGGRMRAAVNEPRGAVFQFILPAGRNETVSA